MLSICLFLGLDVYEEMQKVVKDKYLTLKSQIKSLEKKYWSNLILEEEESLSEAAVIQNAPGGTHTFVADDEEYYIDSKHNVYLNYDDESYTIVGKFNNNTITLDS